MKKWVCEICNYVHEGEEPPDICPVCNATKDKFRLLPPENRLDKSKKELTLEDVRDNARKLLNGICGVYPRCDGHGDRICQRQSYGASIGLGGVGSGQSFAANVSALDHLKLRTQLVGEHFEPDMTLNLFGFNCDFPVIGASTSGVSKYHEAIDEPSFCNACLGGCLDAGTISFRGDTHFYTETDHPGLDAIERHNGKGIQIFKPRAQDILKRLIERAEKAGCPAVGVDLDGCGSTIMAAAGQPVFRKSGQDVQELVQTTSLPFVVKGIMEPEDARACVDAGVKMVSVSNHGGRVLDSTPGVAEVLPAVAEEVSGEVLVTADGGVRTGFDVLKMLALGADAVLIGRDVIRAAIGGGRTGVKLQMLHLKKVLRGAMIMTGKKSLDDIDASILMKHGDRPCSNIHHSRR